MGWIGCVHFEKFNCNVFRYTRDQNGPRGRVSYKFYRPKSKLRKSMKHEFWVKWGGLGAFVLKKSTTSFFGPQVARTALGGGFRMTFVNRNQKCENAPNTSFGSNGVDWVRSFQKIQLQVVSFQKWPERPSGAGFVDRNRNSDNALNMSFGSNGVDWLRSFRKNQHEFFRFNHG